MRELQRGLAAIWPHVEGERVVVPSNPDEVSRMEMGLGESVVGGTTGTLLDEDEPLFKSEALPGGGIDEID